MHFVSKVSAPLMVFILSFFPGALGICSKEDRLRIITLPATGNYLILEPVAGHGERDAAGRRCCQDCRYAPFTVNLPALLGLLALDTRFPRQMIVNADYSAVVSFNIVDRSDDNIKFQAQFYLDGFKSDGCKGVARMLLETCYIPVPGGIVDSASWKCWSSFRGSITALPGSAYSGMALTVYSWIKEVQFGHGANGKNAHLGVSLWFAYDITNDVDLTLPGTRPLESVPKERNGFVVVELRPPELSNSGKASKP